MKTDNLIKNQNGVALVEFGLILPLLILLIFGIIEFSLLLYNQQVITNASREGARAGIIVRSPRLTNQEVIDQVKKYARSQLITFGNDTLEDSDINLLPVNDDPDTFNPATERCRTFGCDLRIAVSYNYDFLVLSNLGFGQKKLQAVSIMRME